MAAIVLQGVSKSFRGSIRAVQQLDLVVEDRQLVVLVGPSGCGKTTALRLIAGLEQADSGTVSIGHRVVNRVAARDRNVAMVFQDTALYPHLTVRDNMAFGLRMRSDWWRVLGGGRQQRKRNDRRVRQAARMLGIESLLERRPRQLSGGQRQRVALGRAIVRQPAAFLFDEPLSNLDVQTRNEIRRQIKRVHERLRATILYVTHDQVEAMVLGDRIVVMRDGEVQQTGHPSEIYLHPRNQFVATFFGEPSICYVPGRYEARGDALFFVGHGLSFQIPPSQASRLSRQADCELVLGLRPEATTLAEPGQPENAVGRILETQFLGDRAFARIALAMQESDLSCFNTEHCNDRTDATAGNTAGHEVVVPVSPGQPPRVGELVGVHIFPEKGLWFDAKTGDNLGKTEAVRRRKLQYRSQEHYESQ